MTETLCRRAGRHLRFSLISTIARRRSRAEGTAVLQICDQHTNKQKQPLRRRLRGLNSERAHTMNNWADKVNVEDGPDVYEVKDHGNGQEACTSKTRHRYGKTCAHERRKELKAQLCKK